MLRVGIAVAVAMASVAFAPASDLEPAFKAILSSDWKFSAADLDDLQQGRIVRHSLGATAPGEVAAVGGVRIDASRAKLLERFRDIVHFKRGPGVLQIGRFSNPPTADDLAALTIGKEDLDLRACRAGDCDIRLPADLIARFQREIDWRAPDADARAAALFKKVLLENVRAYLSGGPGRIVEYNNHKQPIRPLDDFAGLMKNAPSVGRFVPGLPDHLLSFPSKKIEGAEDFLYWSKEKFGIEPFITVTHVTIVRAPSGADVIATKDVYSSRYFDASLAMSIASDAVGAPGRFYLVYANRSRANALKGAFAGLRRSIVERRVRNSLEENLRAMKGRLEDRK